MSAFVPGWHPWIRCLIKYQRCGYVKASTNNCSTVVWPSLVASLMIHEIWQWSILSFLNRKVNVSHVSWKTHTCARLIGCKLCHMSPWVAWSKSLHDQVIVCRPIYVCLSLCMSVCVCLWLQFFVNDLSTSEPFAIAGLQDRVSSLSTWRNHL